MWGRNDLALGRDPSTRFLPGLLAVLVYLAVLAAIGGLTALGFVEDWDRRLSGTMTVQIPPVVGAQAEASRETAGERRDAVLRLLRVTPGIADARPLSGADAAALLEPWLGPELVGTLPMPILVDVRLSPGQPLDRDALAERLENAAPGTTLDDHARWLAEAQAIGRSIAATGLVVIVLVSLAAVLAVVFAVRTGLGVHRDEIEILHLIGAPDRFIAAQFQRHTGRLALVGAVIGAVLAAATLAALQWTAARAASGTGPAGLASLLSSIEFGLRDWIALVALPVGAALIATVTARASVLVALARLP
ncbi:cell division protein [Thalassobaculum fulvum]|jgi:cell division transport system permease protein|uniref:Cell division protein n=1 Tax=Thalassobaculum fulvum TaxID=1633335 RepID=A0A918XNA8_9PROT|nr:FtsX-like permease family protein [Thalassobaculum fulvum]GHD41405.1 cell division protein [Thalassobaculum fulvum]